MKRHPVILSVLLLAGFWGTSPSYSGTDAATASELDSAITFYRAEGAEKALPEFERLHTLFDQSGDRVNVSMAERYIGESHWRLGNYEQSRVHLDHALGLVRELGERLAEGKTLNVCRRPRPRCRISHAPPCTGSRHGAARPRRR